MKKPAYRFTSKQTAEFFSHDSESLAIYICKCIADGSYQITDGITEKLFQEVTDPERRQELVKAICLRNIRQETVN